MSDILSKSKHPPCDLITKFLETYGHKTGRRKIRTDQGGELWGSIKFREAVHNTQYIMEPTALARGALPERPGRTPEPITGQLYAVYTPWGQLRTRILVLCTDICSASLQHATTHRNPADTVLCIYWYTSFS
jgi:hypothetical protein